MDILEIVKLLLNIESKDDTKDVILGLYIEIVEQRILNYCNLSVLPEALKYNVAQMVVEMYSSATGSGIIAGTGAVASIKEGDRTVSFDVSSKAVSLTAQADEKISKLTELDKFKQFYRT